MLTDIHVQHISTTRNGIYSVHANKALHGFTHNVTNIYVTQLTIRANSYDEACEYAANLVANDYMITERPWKNKASNYIGTAGFGI